MIHFTQGDMFEAPADIRVNTVNCVGVMGAGVALAFKQRYPEMFRDYQKACEAGEVRPGHLHVWRSLDGAWIINFPTKRHWRDKSRYEDIEAGLDALRDYLAPLGAVSVALPALGCGHGGLDWSRVSAMIEAKLSDLAANLQVYPPSDSKRAGNVAAETPTVDEAMASEALGYRQLLVPGQRTAYVRQTKDRPLGHWVALIPSKQPSEREMRALASVAAALADQHPKAQLALVHSGRASEELARMFAEAGLTITVIAPFGVLTRKSLTKIVAGPAAERLAVRSWAPLTASWSRQLLAEALEQLRINAHALLLSDPEPSWFVRRSGAWRDLPIAYLRYDGLSSEVRQELDRAGAQALARRSDNGAPKLDALFGPVPPTANISPLGGEGVPNSRELRPHTLVVDLADMPPEAWPRVLARIRENAPSRIQLTVDLENQGAVAALENDLFNLAADN